MLCDLTGPVADGDEVVVNTTAVELGLGTGGWHVVHWNLARAEWSEKGPGHIIKARYTSLQTDVGSAEEHFDPELADVDSIDGMPVVAAALHSQLPAVAVAFKDLRPGRAPRVRDDRRCRAAARALGPRRRRSRDRGLIDATVTCGHAFGGDFEAVSVYSGLAVARHVIGADAAVVVMGPGIVGTGTRLGFSGIEVGPVLDAVTGLQGEPIACLRVSFADERPRHQGVSHHTLTTLRVACRSRVTIPVPTVGGEHEARIRADLEAGGLAERHDLVDVAPVDIVRRLAAHDLTITSMGRPAAADPVLFEAAAAAGVLAAQRAP